jgi:predicted enzyme related to lactoylglutathione lyase
MNTISYFEIHVNDPQRAIAFYNAVFGWKFTQDKSLPLEYYRIETNGMHGGLFKTPGNIYSC